MIRLAAVTGKIAVAGAIVAVPVTVAAAAHAAPYSTAPATVSDSTPAPGEGVTVTGSGFAPNSSVTVEIHSTVVTLATVTADANGTASAAVTIPTGLAPGSSHSIQLIGVDPTGARQTVIVPIVVAGGSSSLPFTGANAVALAATSAGLIGLGSFVTFTGRRKKAARAV